MLRWLYIQSIGLHPAAFRWRIGAAIPHRHFASLTVLRVLDADRNHDGYLTADELIPYEMAVYAGLR